MLRSGSYKNPSRHQLSTHLLDLVYDECKENLSNQLAGQYVTLIQDGWYNIHNEPIIGCCLHNGTKSYFIRSLETGSQKQTAKYCANIAEQEINFCETSYGCRGSCENSSCRECTQTCEINSTRTNNCLFNL